MLVHINNIHSFLGNRPRADYTIYAIQFTFIFLSSSLWLWKSDILILRWKEARRFIPVFHLRSFLGVVGTCIKMPLLGGGHNSASRSFPEKNSTFLSCNLSVSSHLTWDFKKLTFAISEKSVGYLVLIIYPLSSMTDFESFHFAQSSENHFPKVHFQIVGNKIAMLENFRLTGQNWLLALTGST